MSSSAQTSQFRAKGSLWTLTMSYADRLGSTALLLPLPLPQAILPLPHFVGTIQNEALNEALNEAQNAAEIFIQPQLCGSCPTKASGGNSLLRWLHLLCETREIVRLPLDPDP
eukprot:EG_transcript_46402